MKTVGEALQLALCSFKEKNLDRSRRVAEELLMHVLHLSRIQLYLQFDKPLIQQELVLFNQLVKRALEKEPVEYILGRIEFYGCSIHLSQDVLIPRVETEILVDKACGLLKHTLLEGKVAWDLCTGSGCIGIALKKTFPQLQVALSDVSEKALSIAKGNAQRNGVNVELVQGDLLKALSARKVDILFCNPPYISNKEYADLDLSVRGFEPKEALLGGEDGLLFYRQLSKELPLYLNPKALLFFSSS